MFRKLTPLILALLLAPALHAETPATAPAAEELTKLLRNFLDGASRNDVAVHDRFWADDLIYTRSAGVRIGKEDILASAGSPEAAAEAPTVYTAEDIRIQQYGDTAIVAFRLVGTTDKAGKKTVKNYLNTGTFLKRDGKWQAVAWQATVMPEKKEEPKP